MLVKEELQVFSRCQSDLGESPVWDAGQAMLLFVDISGGRINALDEQGNLTTLHQGNEKTGALALAKTGDLLFTRNASVALLDRKDSSVRQLSGPVTHLPSYRFNDGACDPQGRFVTGLMDEGHSQGTGKLYRYDAALNPRVILENINLPNGLVWSIDGTQIFFVDSVARTIYRAPYAADNRPLEHVSVFARTPDNLGRPDGLAMDVEGGIWVCQFNGACLLRYNAQGRLTDTLPMPVPRPTSCCFGGADMRTLFITTARFGMSTSELLAYPQAGDLYRIRLPIAGSPRHRFGLT